MRLLLYPLLWLTTGVIGALIFLGISAEWIAEKAVPLQKFLSKKIEASK